MDDRRELMGVTIGALIAFLLQVLVAPYITIFSAMPNFMLAYVLVVSIVANTNASILAFVMGLLFNIVGGGPIGSISFLFLLAAFCVHHVYVYLDNDTIFIPLLILAMTSVLVEILYAAFLLGMGLETNVVDAMVYRVLPCALYDTVIAFIMYPLAVKFLTVQEKVPGVPQLR